MDKEEILKKNQYKHDKTTFFQRNEVKIEIVALLIVGIALFYHGTVMIFHDQNTTSVVSEQNSTSIVEEKSSDNSNDLENVPGGSSENQDVNHQPVNEDPKDVSTENPISSEQQTSEEQLNRFVVKNVLGLIVYSKEHKAGDIVTLDNVAVGSYFLGDNTDMTLFTINAPNNKVECTIGAALESSVCNVTDLLPIE